MSPTSVSSPVELTVWRDRKRWKYLLALIVPALPFIAGALVALTSWNLLWWSGPILVFGLVPILDTVFGVNTTNPPEELERELEAQRWYRICTYLYLPGQFAGLVWAARLWAQGDMSLLSNLGLAFTVGCVSGIAINTAHELGHKHPRLEQWLAKVVLAQSAYGHFFMEHNRGHHQKVSTPEDPASARFGESFWEFLPRTVVGSLRSAIHLEHDRSKRLGRSFWSPRNDVLNAWVMSVAIFVGLLIAFDWSIAPYLAVQAVFGFCLLEVVNYIEHYGLLRARKDNGRYERCRPEHSWNASQSTSNLFLYQLQRHSDHHANPTRRYQILRHFDEVPQLPSGYATMITLATVPPLWRRVMDRRVLDHYDGDLSKVNIHPRARARVEARYGSATAAGA